MKLESLLQELSKVQQRIAHSGSGFAYSDNPIIAQLIKHKSNLCHQIMLIEMKG